MSSRDDTETRARPSALRVFKTAPPNGERGWYGSNEPQGNDQVPQLVQARGKRNEGDRTGQRKGPRGPGGRSGPEPRPSRRTGNAPRKQTTRRSVTAPS